VPGITVVASGSPASRSTVRIRGISSFQNNDPLYVIDGVPVQDSYINWLNPADITSIQVLKDASAASIYGSRASNGVIVIETTKRGASGPPRVTFSARTGLASPTRGYDDFLINNALDYFQVVKTSFTNAKLAVPTNIFGDPNNPSVPTYTYAADNTYTTKDAFGRPLNVDVNKYSYPSSLIMPGSSGTNWWKAVFPGQAPVGDYNLNVAGSGEDHTYGVSANYFDQRGTAVYNDFRRGSLRANTQFTRGKLTFGENAALAAERSVGGMGDPGGYAEDGIVGKNILMQPVVPIYDINGNFASGKSGGLGNQSNPLKFAYERRNNLNNNNRIFGNGFAGFQAMPALALRSSIGFNIRQGTGKGYNPTTFENSEPGTTNGFNENQESNLDWTWTNTARYNKQMGSHTFNLLGRSGSEQEQLPASGSLDEQLQGDRSELAVHPGCARRSGHPQHAELREQELAAVVLRQGRLQLPGQVRGERHGPSRRLVAPRSGPSLGHLPGVRPRLAHQQGRVPGEQQDPLGRHAALRLRRDGQPADSVGPHRVAVRRRPR
jgi:TonB-dependent SusC/RagA subfamily outer membrane receptor